MLPRQEWQLLMSPYDFLLRHTFKDNKVYGRGDASLLPGPFSDLTGMQGVLAILMKIPNRGGVR
jgi:hypothetical protein